MLLSVFGHLRRPSACVRSTPAGKIWTQFHFYRRRLKFVGRSCTETSVPIYRTARRHVAQDRNLLVHHSGKLQSQAHWTFRIFTPYYKIHFNIILQSTSRCNRCLVPVKFSEVLLYPLVASSSSSFIFFSPPPPLLSLSISSLALLRCNLIHSSFYPKYFQHWQRDELAESHKNLIRTQQESSNRTLSVWTNGLSVLKVSSLGTKTFQQSTLFRKNEMSGPCSAYGVGERRIQSFCGETWRKDTTWDTQALIVG